MTHIPRNPYKETPREARSPSQRRKPKDLPPEDGQEEEKARFKEADRQEEQNQEEPERERVRAHLVTRPKTVETWREKVNRDQKR